MRVEHEDQLPDDEGDCRVDHAVQPNALNFQIFNKAPDQFDHYQKRENIGHCPGQVDFSEVFFKNDVERVEDFQKPCRKNKNDVYDQYVNDIFNSSIK